MTYELVGHLATGGMAELFLARRGGEEYVVLKRILAAHARRPHFVTMFLDEARLAARLDHPNIARLIDVGRSTESYFYTMEYVHGENVRDLLERAHVRDRRVPVEVSLTVIAAAAAGLHAAHEQRDRRGRPLGIVHRDVSPSNVMVAHDGAVKLVDFGVATAADRLTETRTGTVKGKVAYLSPEQCRLRPVDRRSDVFALGIVAWEMLTQQRLFRYESDYDVMHAIVEGPIVPPSAVCDDVAPWLDALVLRALDRDPERRPQTADELRAAVLEGARTEGLALGPAVVAAHMEALFGRPPLPWLDPAFAARPRGDDVVTVDLIDARPRSERALPEPTPSTGPREPSVIVDATTGETQVARAVVPETVRPPAVPARSWSATVATGAAALTMVALAVSVGSGDGERNDRGDGAIARAAELVAQQADQRAQDAEAQADQRGEVAEARADQRAEVAEAHDRRPAGDAVPTPASPARPSRRAPTSRTRAAAAPTSPLDRARAAAKAGAWTAALDACSEGLHSDPTGAELIEICAMAACNLGRAGVARVYIGRLSAERAQRATAACVARGTFTSSTECDDDPTRCR